MAIVVKLRCEICDAETAAILCYDTAPRRALKPVAQNWWRIRFSEGTYCADICPSCAKDPIAIKAHVGRRLSALNHRLGGHQASPSVQVSDEIVTVPPLEIVLEKLMSPEPTPQLP